MHQPVSIYINLNWVNEYWQSQSAHHFRFPFFPDHVTIAMTIIIAITITSVAFQCNFTMYTVYCVVSLDGTYFFVKYLHLFYVILQYSNFGLWVISEFIYTQSDIFFYIVNYYTYIYILLYKETTDLYVFFNKFSFLSSFFSFILAFSYHCYYILDTKTCS